MMRFAAVACLDSCPITVTFPEFSNPFSSLGKLEETCWDFWRSLDTLTVDFVSPTDSLTLKGNTLEDLNIYFINGVLKLRNWILLLSYYSPSSERVKYMKVLHCAVLRKIGSWQTTLTAATTMWCLYLQSCNILGVVIHSPCYFSRSVVLPLVKPDDLLLLLSL